MATQSKLVGFIGVGVMGGPMARRLIERGHQLIVHDVNAAAVRAFVKLGARAARSPREIADRARTVLVSLPTPQIAREVALGNNGVIRGRAVKTFIDLSTNGSISEVGIAAHVRFRLSDLGRVQGCGARHRRMPGVGRPDVGRQRSASALAVRLRSRRRQTRHDNPRHLYRGMGGGAGQRQGEPQR